MGLRYITSFFVSLAVTVVTGLILVPALRRVKAGQSIREDGPVWHINKQGTPTMGGIMFMVGITAACLTAGFDGIRNGRLSHIYILLFALIYAAIGFIDDRQKLKKKAESRVTRQA